MSVAVKNPVLNLYGGADGVYVIEYAMLASAALLAAGDVRSRRIPSYWFLPIAAFAASCRMLAPAGYGGGGIPAADMLMFAVSAVFATVAFGPSVWPR